MHFQNNDPKMLSLCVVQMPPLPTSDEYLARFKDVAAKEPEFDASSFAKLRVKTMEVCKKIEYPFLASNFIIECMHVMAKRATHISFVPWPFNGATLSKTIMGISKIQVYFGKVKTNGGTEEYAKNSEFEIRCTSALTFEIHSLGKLQVKLPFVYKLDDTPFGFLPDGYAFKDVKDMEFRMYDTRRRLPEKSREGYAMVACVDNAGERISATVAVFPDETDKAEPLFKSLCTFLSTYKDNFGVLSYLYHDIEFNNSNAARFEGLLKSLKTLFDPG